MRTRAAAAGSMRPSSARTCRAKAGFSSTASIRMRMSACRRRPGCASPSLRSKLPIASAWMSATTSAALRAAFCTVSASRKAPWWKEMRRSPPASSWLLARFASPAATGSGTSRK